MLTITKSIKFYQTILKSCLGSYGTPVNLNFREDRAYLLKKGWILMFPHVRLVTHTTLTIHFYCLLIFTNPNSQPKKGAYSAPSW